MGNRLFVLAVAGMALLIAAILGFGNTPGLKVEPAKAAAPTVVVLAPNEVDWLVDGAYEDCADDTGIDVLSGGPGTCAVYGGPDVVGGAGIIRAADGLLAGASYPLEYAGMDNAGDADGILEASDLTNIDRDADQINENQGIDAQLARSLAVIAFIDTEETVTFAGSAGGEVLIAEGGPGASYVCDTVAEDPDCVAGADGGEDGIVVAHLWVNPTPPARGTYSVSVTGTTMGTTTVSTINVVGDPASMTYMMLSPNGTLKADGNAPDCSDGPLPGQTIKTLARAQEIAESPEFELIVFFANDSTGTSLTRQVTDFSTDDSSKVDVAMPSFISVDLGAGLSATTMQLCSGASAGSANITATSAVNASATATTNVTAGDPTLSFWLDMDASTADIENDLSIPNGGKFTVALVGRNIPSDVGGLDASLVYNKNLVLGNPDPAGGNKDDNPDLNHLAGDAVTGSTTLLESGFLSDATSGGWDCTASGTTEPHAQNAGTMNDVDTLKADIGCFRTGADTGTGTGVVAYISFDAVGEGDDATAWHICDQDGTGTADCNGDSVPDSDSDDQWVNNMHLEDVALADPLAAEMGSCHDFLTLAMYCGDGEVEVTPATDLSVTKVDDQDPVVGGTQLTYTITANNGAGAVAENVIVTDTLPSGMTVVSVTPSQGSCSDITEPDIQCELGDIAASGSATVVIVVDVSATLGGTTPCDLAAVSSDTADPNPDNNEVEECTSVLSPSVSMEKDPAKANLWLCDEIEEQNDGINNDGDAYIDEPDEGECLNYADDGDWFDMGANVGEGMLRIEEIVSNATDPDGVGAYEFQLKFDHKIFDITITDASWLGSTGRTVNCSVTVVTENYFLFGCVSTGSMAGPTVIGPATLAHIDVWPEPDLYSRIGPYQENGVWSDLLDENCELADIYGDPLRDAQGNLLLGINPGGDLMICSDSRLTVRILEADVNLDCEVDVVDEQMEAFRYGATFGSLRYNRWFDLEPWNGDFDIDIKDLQKVFGRDGSTCQDPIPPQDPVDP